MSKLNIQPLLNHQYIIASRAEGIWIYDEKGKKYLDGSSGPVTSSIGHCNIEIKEHISKQLDRLDFVYRTQFDSLEARELADKLSKCINTKEDYYSFFVNSGTEAIETTMKMAIQYWQELGFKDKTHFITRKKSYHGITQGALSLSGHPLRRERFESILDKFPALEADFYIDDLDLHIDELEKVIEKKSSQKIAAIVLETVVGASGSAQVPPNGYFQALKEICTKHNILLIADEVLCGMGRTGKWLAMDHWHTKPDILAIGKSLGAGYTPIAAGICCSKILEVIKKGSGVIMAGHTYSANPLSCSVANKVLEIIENDNLISNAITQGDYLSKQLTILSSKYSCIEKVQGIGLLWGIEFDPKINGIRNKVLNKCFDLGLLLYPSVGTRTGDIENGLIFSPPMIIQNDEIDILIQIFEQALIECL